MHFGCFSGQHMHWRRFCGQQLGGGRKRAAAGRFFLKKKNLGTREKTGHQIDLSSTSRPLSFVFHLLVLSFLHSMLVFFNFFSKLVDGYIGWGWYEFILVLIIGALFYHLHHQPATIGLQPGNFFKKKSKTIFWSLGGYFRQWALLVGSQGTDLWA